MKTPTEMIKYLNENYGIQDLDKIIKGITKAKVKIIKIKEPNYLEMLDMVSDKKNKIRPVINNICCNKNISIAKIVPTLEKLLKDGKTVQMEYNHQTNEIKVLENKMKRKPKIIDSPL